MSLKSFKDDLSAVRGEEPLRAELFSLDQFERHAVSLAGLHKITYRRGREKLLSRLKENEDIIMKAYELLAETEDSKRKVSPAGDWLLDNYYLVEEQIRLARRFLPKGYSRELPALIKGPLSGYPRVYDIAMEIVSHGDGRVDLKWLAGYVRAYQTVEHLKLGELWALPIMIRLALIENLRRVSSRMVLSQIDNDRADYWANRILAISGKNTDGIVLEIASMARFDLPLSEFFVAEFVRRLQGQTSALNFPLVWLEKKLSEKGETIDRLIQITSMDQAADQVSIANTIMSLRFLDTVNWHEFVEDLSVVENILRNDPSGDYKNMSFTTRDSYRHIIENISSKTGSREEETASHLIQTAEETGTHIGYYLSGKGLSIFCKSLGIRPKSLKTGQRLFLYTGSIILLSIISAFCAMYSALGPGLAAWRNLFLYGLPLLFISSQASLTLVNWISTLLVRPEKLPRMDFSRGIPSSAHTLAVVPSILTSVKTVESLIENLEIRYLANADPEVDFGLLTDFADAASETLPEDDLLLSTASEGIERLNLKYRRLKENSFYFFHRPRKWNKQENKWMGYERKRGKLSDLNSLLRGKTGAGRFCRIIGDISLLQDVKYVITVDTDTLMPRNCARDLIEIISHPLNRPVIDGKKNRVISGYGILQPRVEAGYPGDNPSIFVKVFGGETGIDPYTKAVSDVYQDLFQEGSFIGKGLYDVDAFEKCLEGRFPENRILSHYLLEGCYARCALVTDVQLYEKYPEGYLEDMSRRRRWIRGDWQIAAWLLPFVPGFTKNPLSFLSRWKIMDNLRRSLVLIAAVLLILSGLPIAVIVLAALPGILMSLAEIIKKPREGITPALIRAARFFISLSFSAYEACAGLSDIARTLWRLTVSRKRLLEWVASGESSNRPEKISGYYKRMMPAPLLTASFMVFSALVFKYADIPALAISVCGFYPPSLPVS